MKKKIQKKLNRNSMSNPECTKIKIVITIQKFLFLETFEIKLLCVVCVCVSKQGKY